MQYRDAVKFTVKPKSEVRTYIADASNLHGTSKDESAKVVAHWIATIGKEAYEKTLVAGLNQETDTTKEVSRACRAVYLFARASHRGAFDAKYSDISATDNRTSEDFLKLAREILTLMDSEKLDNVAK